jgi:hypothetical protein
MSLLVLFNRPNGILATTALNITPTAAPLPTQRFSVTRELTNSNVKTVVGRIGIQTTIGEPINVVLRIGLPVLEPEPVATLPVIRTTGSIISSPFIEQTINLLARNYIYHLKFTVQETMIVKAILLRAKNFLILAKTSNFISYILTRPRYLITENTIQHVTRSVHKTPLSVLETTAIRLAILRQLRHEFIENVITIFKHTPSKILTRVAGEPSLYLTKAELRNLLVRAETDNLLAYTAIKQVFSVIARAVPSLVQSLTHPLHFNYLVRAIPNFSQSRFKINTAIVTTNNTLQRAESKSVTVSSNVLAGLQQIPTRSYSYLVTVQTNLQSLRTIKALHNIRPLLALLKTLETAHKHIAVTKNHLKHSLLVQINYSESSQQSLSIVYQLRYRVIVSITAALSRERIIKLLARSSTVKRITKELSAAFNIIATVTSRYSYARIYHLEFSIVALSNYTMELIRTKYLTTQATTINELTKRIDLIRNVLSQTQQNIYQLKYLTPFIIKAETTNRVRHQLLHAILPVIATTYNSLTKRPLKRILNTIIPTPNITLYRFKRLVARINPIKSVHRNTIMPRINILGKVISRSRHRLHITPPVVLSPMTPFVNKRPLLRRLVVVTSQYFLQGPLNLGFRLVIIARMGLIFHKQVNKEFNYKPNIITRLMYKFSGFHLADFVISPSSIMPRFMQFVTSLVRGRFTKATAVDIKPAAEIPQAMDFTTTPLPGTIISTTHTTIEPSMIIPEGMEFISANLGSKTISPMVLSIEPSANIPKDMAFTAIALPGQTITLNNIIDTSVNTPKGMVFTVNTLTGKKIPSNIPIALDSSKIDSE